MDTECVVRVDRRARVHRVFRNSVPDSLSATVAAGLGKCCGRAGCLVWLGTVPGSTCAVRIVAGTMVGCRSPGNPPGSPCWRVSAQRIAGMWRPRLTRAGLTASGTHMPMVFFPCPCSFGRPVAESVGSRLFRIYISPLRCAQPDHQEIAGLMACAGGNSRANSRENRQGGAVSVDGRGRRSLVAAQTVCGNPARHVLRFRQERCLSERVCRQRGGQRRC